MYHGWSAFFPVWAREGGPERFADDPPRSRSAEDQEGQGLQTWVKEHGGWDGIVMGRAESPEGRSTKGCASPRSPRLRGDADPADTCITLMADEGGRITGMFHTMSEDDVRLVMKQPWVAIASDGSAINLEAEACRIRATTARMCGCSATTFATSTC